MAKSECKAEGKAQDRFTQWHNNNLAFFPLIVSKFWVAFLNANPKVTKSGHLLAYRLTFNVQHG